MNGDSFEDDNSARLRRRLWGAAVLIAIAVIVLPLILDGGGSESQFRRVERLREEPPAIVDSDGNRTVQVVPKGRSIPQLNSAADVDEEVIGDDTADDSPGNDAIEPDSQPPKDPTLTARPPLTAWVVEAAIFSDEQQAIALRDRLRGAGFASFVRDRDAGTDPFRVLVGPMIKQETAERARRSVAALLQNSPVIISYP